MNKTIDYTHLKCITESSNKFYDIKIIENEELSPKYKVMCSWGRIGTKGSSQEKGSFITLDGAKNQRDHIAFIKKQKGYIDSSFKEMTKQSIKSKENNKYLNRFIDLLED